VPFSTRKRLGLLVVLALGAAFGACSLNPQPIPPGADNARTAGDASAFGSSDHAPPAPGTVPASPADAATDPGDNTPKDSGGVVPNLDSGFEFDDAGDAAPDAAGDAEPDGPDA
jgi:hypothetical protein